MNNTDIAVCSCGRVSSKRCPKKMVRPFHDTTLVDIFLSKLAQLKKNIFFAGYEDIFKEKCEHHNVPFVQRSREAAYVDEPASKIYEFFSAQDYDYFLMVNACSPFLSLSTIEDFIEQCARIRKPCFSVIKKRNYFVTLEGKPLNWSLENKELNTKIVDPIYEFSHIFYFFKKEYFVKNGWFWDWKEVQYIELPVGTETIDIDTEEDFLLAETIWKTLNK